MVLESENPDSLARSSMYRLLAGLFAKELTEENIVGFQKGDGSQLLDALTTVQAYAPAVSRLKVYFATITDPQQSALDLAESYAWNFHGVGGPHATPLYASVYLSKSGATHQEVEGELRKIINEQGLSSEISDQEPYDHLSVILEFVAWMDEKQKHTQQRKYQEDFIEKYLLSWLPAFASKCNQADRLGFYSALSTVTLAFVEADLAQIR
jgi:TorA-specific chaperone